MTTMQQTPLTDEHARELAARIGRVAAPFDPEHDRDATFVTEAYAEMAACGYLRLAVPEELGGLGASMRQVVIAEEELGSWSGSAALAAAMHLYLTLVQRWRWRRGAPDAAGVLGKIADGLIMATSGGSDWVCPTTTATEVEGGYRLDGRKVFCTQAPVAGVISTSAVLGSPGPDAVVLHAGVPLAAPGVHIIETWDTLGMRGTASHDVVFDGVYLPADKVVGQRPYGVLAGPLLVAAVHFAPVRRGGLPRGGPRGLSGGRAHRDRAGPPDHHRGPAARGDAGAAPGGALGAAGRGRGDRRRPGRRRRHAGRRHDGQAARGPGGPGGGRPGPGGGRRSRVLPHVLAGGAYRDVRGGPFHPLTPEATLAHVGERILQAGIE